jgi:hypothetical protein
MKRIVLLSPLLLVLFQLSGYSQSATITPEQTMIRDLEIKWMTAVAKKDSVVLNELLGKNFELAKIGGRASTNIRRDKWIQNYMNMDWSKFEFHSMQISIDSNLATVNCELSFKLRPYPFRLSSGILDIWRKTDGKWRVEKRYLSQDNLSRWLLITEGIVAGVLLLLFIQWLKAIFTNKAASKD